MTVLVLAAMLVLAAVLPAQGQVRVDIGIRLPAPPVLVVVPGVPVYYARSAPENVFFYADEYWAFHDGGWYVSPTWNGPWTVVAAVHVPVPILRIPVRYYSVRPSHWKTWRREAPPRWEAQYGRDWREDDRERRWRDREKHWDKREVRDRDKGTARDRDKGGKGRGHGKRDD